MHEQLGISVHNIDLDYINNKNYKRVQICHKFSDASKLNTLVSMIKKNSLKVNYHAAVFHNMNPNITYYLNSNEKLRNATFEILETNLKMAKSLNSENVVVHFASSDIDESLSNVDIKKLARDSASRINDLAKKYDIEIALEYCGYNDRFYKIDEYISLVSEFKNLSICLDLGHLFISCKLHNMSYFMELSKIVPFTKLVHIWNTRGPNDLEKYGHIPVHPKQREEDGWIDVETSLKFILTYNKDVRIIAEPDFIYSDFSYFEEGMEWVNGIVNEALR